MNRREAIERVAWLLGGTVIGTEFFISGCKPTSSKVEDLFDQEHVAYMDEIAETILPRTKTPGAKDAKVGAFMAVMVRDCYTPEDQKTFLDGLNKINDATDKKFSVKFMQADVKQRTQILDAFDKEQMEYTKKKKEDEPNHFYRMIKELTLLGFFTSEPGCTQALRYVPVPGKYDGDYPYKKGDKAFALA
ncbi:gluconate 2-dehydrogenase subunit 3 family protein [Mucilaginibacter sp. RS28]|uniref:Gluconate 2-dehydrogenase subunit 3 family protein n=1 Tax=Mucilaginibacter straminoryzae TaxID=2932774 RepID=A0A9X2B9Z8_9SPHI|nr:gluconate 2-dehydrogenase subunit 3 family protein [Mucilaginibacter straminoryzae]MCJ8210946.1 gluconate 2-dehydrogenase subunit 3 family protein [Mucilaginibacter straminoryzae]